MGSFGSVLDSTSSKPHRPHSMHSSHNMAVSLRSDNYPSLFVRHQCFRLKLTARSSPLDHVDSSFNISELKLPSGQTAIAFQSTNFPDHFVAVKSDGAVWIERLPTGDIRSQFIARPGLGDSSACSLESAAMPNHFLRHSGFMMFAHAPDGTILFRKDATFWWHLPASATSATAEASASGLPVCTAAPVTAALPLMSPASRPFAPVMSITSSLPSGFIRLEPKVKPGAVVRHHDSFVRTSDASLPRTAVDAQFRLMPAVNGQEGCVSFEALGHPGSFLR